MMKVFCFSLGMFFPLFILTSNAQTDSVNIKSDSAEMIEVIDSALIENKNYIEKFNASDAEFNKFIDHFDKIYLRNNELLIVRVKNIDDKFVNFNYPLNSGIEKISRDEVGQILYSDGKRDIYYLPDSVTKQAEVSGAMVQQEKDWEKVTITDNEADIDASSIFIEKIKSVYEADRFNASTKFLEKNATIILKRRAASLGGDIILLEDKDISRPYGELPKITLKGSVYRKEE